MTEECTACTRNAPLLYLLADALEAVTAERDRLMAAIEETVSTCDRVLAVKLSESTKADAAAAGVAAALRTVLSAALNEGKTDDQG